MTRRAPDRRSLLATGASALAALLAGCARSAGEERTPPEEDRESAGGNRTLAEDEHPRTPRTTTGGEPAGTTPTPEPMGTGPADELLLPSLDVAGSPGGLVPIRPPGKAVLLDFFATWCPPCETEMKHLRSVRERYDPEEAAVVSVTRERDEAAVASFWREHRATWPVVTDPNARGLRRHDVTTIPTIVTFAPDGTEVDRGTGLLGEERLVEGLEAALRDG